jgi:alkanesulfonate monooxygenase SsuD/methylene tetrahydromethanopterin reductase-like flavin-dependent oxidoreductase (luciferase family)
MRLGLFLSSLGEGPEAYAGMVRAAEESGLDSVWVPDHVLKVFGPVLDPLTALAFLAGSTSRIELGTGVLVLPYRHPVPLANAASTLDVLSGGRFVLGAGAG